jgi:hypothetical protein
MMGKWGLRTSNTIFRFFAVQEENCFKVVDTIGKFNSIDRKMWILLSNGIANRKSSKPIKKEDHSGSGLEAVLWYILSQYEAEFNYKEFIRVCEPKRNITDKTSYFLTDRKYNKVMIRNEISTKLENVTEIKKKYFFNGFGINE